MPVYTVKDNKTGKTVKFNWNGEQPPNETDMEEVFSQARIKETALGAEVPNVSVTDKPTAIQQDYPWRRKAMELIRPTLEMIGGGVGGVIGSGVGPLGTVAGAGLGYGSGRTIADLLEEAMGIRKPTPYGASPVGRLHKGAEDVATGSLFEMGGQLLGQSTGKLLDKTLARTPLSAEANKALDIANRERVYLSPADIKQTKGLSLAEQVFYNSPLSATVTQKKKLETIKGLTDYRNRILEQGGQGTIPDYLGRKAQMEIDDYINQLGLAKSANLNDIRNNILKRMGSNETYESLGKATQEQLKASSRELFDKAGATYRAFYSQLPEGTAIPTNKLSETADKLIQEQMALPEGARDYGMLRLLQGYGSKELPEELAALPPELQQQAIQQIGGLNNAYDPKSIQSIRSDLFKRAMNEDAAMQMNQSGYKFVGSSKGGVFKQLRNALDEDIRIFAEQTGGEPWETFNLANKIYREGKEIFNKAEVIKAMRSNPEKALDVLIQPGNTTGVQFARKSLGNEFFDNQLKPKLTSKLIDKATINNNFDPGLFTKELEKYGDSLNSIYKPEELEYLRGISKVGLRIKDAPMVDKYFVGLVKALENRPQAVVRMIINPKNVKTIQKAKSVLSRETWDDVERTFLSDLMTVNKPIAGQADEFISPSKFETALFKYSDDTLKAALSPENYKAVKDLALLSKYTQAAERQAGNPSGTAQNVIAWGQGAMIWRDPVTGIAMALTPPVFAKLYFSKFGRKLIVDGIKTPAGIPKGVEIGTKLSAILARSQKEDKRFETSQEVK